MRPNIVMYFSDQQRADTCGCYGQKLDITPNLDQLAKEGIKFEMHFLHSRCADLAVLCSRLENGRQKQVVLEIILCYHLM